MEVNTWSYCVWVGVFAAPLFLAVALTGDTPPPDFAGTWQMDAAQSHVEDGRVVTLTIQDVADGIRMVRVVHERNGRDVSSQFTCPIGGSQCEFDEGSHKAKVSLWYEGSALILLKTDGPKEDATTEWKMQLSPDVKTLSLDMTHIDPSTKEETIVFNRSAPGSTQGPTK